MLEGYVLHLSTNTEVSKDIQHFNLEKSFYIYKEILMSSH